MKWISVTILMILNMLFFAQSVSHAQTQIKRFSEYGKIFTPRGELKVLVVFCRFKDYHADKDNIHWKADDSIPTWAKGKNFFFTDLKDFDNIPANNRSLSRYYYDMTSLLPHSERFKLYAGYLSVTIDTNNIQNKAKWKGTIKAACDELKKIKGIEKILEEYDNRTNNSNYTFDNSNSKPDKILDYVIFSFRRDNKWAKQPIKGMETWKNGVDGYTSSELCDENIGGYTIKDGFCACVGINPSVKFYTHELGHSIYDAPHYGHCNRVTGKSLMVNKFWGMMSTVENEIFAGANAWERWFLGWINLKHDLKDINDNGVYRLKDYYTTGDAIRIKMPYVDKQYIWLEYHIGKSIYEERWDYGTKLCGNTLPPPPKGLMVYIEGIEDKKENFQSDIFINKPNRIKLLDNNGLFDYVSIKSEVRSEWCGNKITLFEKQKANPYSGYSTTSSFLCDKDSNKRIDYSTNENRGSKDQEDFIWINNQFVYGNFGTNSGFNNGKKVGISSNPAITNIQTYNENKKKLTPIYLNGISIKTINTGADYIDVEIKFNDYDIENSVRMCGDIILPPTKINIKQNKQINIDKSGTANKVGEITDLINPTIIASSPKTILNLEPYSSIIIENGSSLIVKSGSNLVLNDGCFVTIKKGSILYIENGATLELKGNSQINVEEGAFLAIENNANIYLRDYLSVIKLKNENSLNANALPNFQNNTFIKTITAIKKDGNGSVLTAKDITIKNRVISRNTYIWGNNIYIGNTNKTGNGNVIIKSGNKVIVEAENNILIGSGTEIQKETTLKVNN